MKHDLFHQWRKVRRQMVLAGAGRRLAWTFKGACGGTYQAGGSKPLQGVFSRHAETGGSTSVMERPDDVLPKEPVRHIYHAGCQRGKNPAIAYCGHKMSSIGGTNWYPEKAEPRDCTMCITARAFSGCPLCGYKPEK